MGRRLRAILVLSLLAAVAAAPSAGAGSGDDPPTGDPTTEPAPTVLRVDHDHPALAPVASDRAGEAWVRARAVSVAPFTMIGVGAPDIADGHLEGSGSEPELRVHTPDEGWGPWMAVEFSADHAPDADSPEAVGSLPASEPIWVRSADGYEVRLPAEVERSGVTVHLVRDTGRPAPTLVEPDAAPDDPAVANRIALGRADKPPIRSRASWGARPATVPPLRADNLTLAVVHHSVTTNAYTPPDVPGIIRAIQAFHMDANGWYDIAYNFVVDRFGTIWEGRAGGVGNAVIGGHAKGFNTGSTGVVTLGEFTVTVPTSAMVASVSNLLGWKLFIHGVDPDTTTVFTSKGNETYPEGTRVTLPRIVGHRDTSATACPGNQVEARLPVIRSGATAIYDALRGPGMFVSLPLSLDGGDQLLTGDFDGDGNDDAFVYGPGDAGDLVAWGHADGSFTTVSVDVEGTYQPLVADFDGDYHDDVFWYGPGAAYDKLWYGTAGGSFDRVDVEVNGTYQPVVGDWNDDDAFDVIWYGPGAGVDHLWFGERDRTFSSYPVDISRTYEPVLGDFDGDGYDDLLWYGPGSAPDRLWWGRPARSLASTPASVSGVYQPFVGDFTGDQRDDIVWYAPGSASDSMWSGRIDRSFLVRHTLSINGTYRPLVGDFNGGGYDDVVLYGPGSAPDRLWMSAGDGYFRSSSVSVSGDYRTAVIDLATDGRADVLWYGTGGATDRLWLAAS